MALKEEAPCSGYQTLAQLADWYYQSAELYEDDDLEPNDHVAVVVRAFVSSDCGPFAYVLNRVTGWQVVAVSADQGYLHSLVRAPDGRMLDAAGWVTERAVKKRYGARKIVMLDVEPGHAMGLGCFLGEMDETGRDGEMCRLVSAIRALPHAPFNEAWFRELSGRPIEGVDLPLPEESACGSDASSSPPAGTR